MSASNFRLEVRFSLLFYFANDIHILVLILNSDITSGFTIITSSPHSVDSIDQVEDVSSLLPVEANEIGEWK